MQNVWGGIKLCLKAIILVVIGYVAFFAPVILCGMLVKGPSALGCVGGFSIGALAGLVIPLIIAFTVFRSQKWSVLAIAIILAVIPPLALYIPYALSH